MSIRWIVSYYIVVYIMFVCYHSDGGSDSSVSDGPPVHMIGNKSNKRKVGTVVDYMYSVFTVHQ